MYYSNGSAKHDYVLKAIVGEHPSYTVGSKITFTLNLEPNQKGNGTLSAQIDRDGGSFILFTGLCKHLKAVTVGKVHPKEVRGFVPAVTVDRPGRVRLVDIRKL